MKLLQIQKNIGNKYCTLNEHQDLFLKKMQEEKELLTVWPWSFARAMSNMVL